MAAYGESGAAAAALDTAADGMVDPTGDEMVAAAGGDCGCGCVSWERMWRTSWSGEGQCLPQKMQNSAAGMPDSACGCGCGCGGGGGGGAGTELGWAAVAAVNCR